MCPNLGSDSQPFWCMEQRSNQLSHPARAVFEAFKLTEPDLIVCNFFVLLQPPCIVPVGQFGHKCIFETKCLKDGFEKHAEKYLYVIYVSCYLQ